MRIISQENLEELRHKVDIVDVVSQYVQLTKKGKDYKGLCPFHNEKTPSFYVNEEKQFFHCFGCGKVGDVFKFIQEIDGLTFPESIVKSIDYLKTPLSFDIDVNAQDTHSTSSQSRNNETLIEMHQKAVEIYHHILINTPTGEPALKYLFDRGLTKETIETFQIGYAPAERVVLSRIFSEKENDTLYNLSGLFVQKDDGTFVDRFFERIMFPILNLQGKIVAFSGRAFFSDKTSQSDTPKYLNSPETPIFIKSETLYNYSFARKEIKERNEAILFEGYMDVISAWQAGIKNGIASMGTSLTNNQIKSIERVSDTVLIAYDGDSAGQKATNRAIELLTENSGLNIKVIEFPSQLDPDEYIKTYGAEQFQHIMLHQQKTSFSFKMSYLKKDKDLNVESEKLTYLENILSELGKVPSIIEREMYVNEISQEFGLTTESIKKQLNIYNSRKEYTNSKQIYEPFDDNLNEPINRVEPISRVEKAEMLLLNRSMNDILVFKMLKSDSDFNFVHESYEELFILLDVYYDTHREFNSSDFLSDITDQLLSKKLVMVLSMNLSNQDSTQEIKDCLQILKVYNIEQKRDDVLFEQKKASSNGDKESESRLAIEVIKLTRQLKSYGVN